MKYWLPCDFTNLRGNGYSFHNGPGSIENCTVVTQQLKRRGETAFLLRGPIQGEVMTCNYTVVRIGRR
jgi:hypothetical protein